MLQTFSLAIPTDVGDPHSDPNYLHVICAQNFRFDRQQRDGDGIPNDLDSMCYTHCILGTIGVIDSEEKLHIDVLMPSIDDANAQMFTQKCGRLSK